MRIRQLQSNIPEIAELHGLKIPFKAILLAHLQSIAWGNGLVRRVKWSLNEDIGADSEQLWKKQKSKDKSDVKKCPEKGIYWRYYCILSYDPLCC